VLCRSSSKDYLQETEGQRLFACLISHKFHMIRVCSLFGSAILAFYIIPRELEHFILAFDIVIL